jgi:hypothetical protein
VTRWRFILLLVCLMAVTGCGSPAPEKAPEEAPLTVEQWKALPTDRKYEIDTFERLKAGNPNLQNQKEWDRFTREVILPARKKDVPDGSPR